MERMTPNIPLLRKAVEWAEAEAAKPDGQWLQATWTTRPNDDDYWFQWLRKASGLTAECGTTYCIAGYVAEVIVGRNPGQGWSRIAAEALGLTDFAAEELFDANNTIEDIRRIAEDIAGELL